MSSPKRFKGVVGLEDKMVREVNLEAALKGWKSVAGEYDQNYPISNGTLPANFPKGTLYRNGAGKLETPDGQPITQPFDGDGYVSSFTFDDSD